MLNSLFLQDVAEKPYIKEGDLYKTVNLYGHIFELYYGYYEECERHNPLVEPMPIYPDFIKEPKYTDEGFPFVTKMQDACKHYKGSRSKFNDCAECEYYKHGDELIGICTCLKNKHSLSRNNTDDCG